MARAITRVADAATESYFLSVASHGTVHHVEKLVRGYRRAEAAELSREAQQQVSRSLAYGHDDDGSLVMKVRLPAEIGALVHNAGLHIDHRTATTRWKGESMDYGFAVQALMQRWER
jgi:hypothetical protein